MINPGDPLYDVLWASLLNADGLLNRDRQYVDVLALGSNGVGVVLTGGYVSSFQFVLPILRRSSRTRYRLYLRFWIGNSSFPARMFRLYWDPVEVNDGNTFTYYWDPSNPDIHVRLTSKESRAKAQRVYLSVPYIRRPKTPRNRVRLISYIPYKRFVASAMKRITSGVVANSRSRYLKRHNQWFRRPKKDPVNPRIVTVPVNVAQITGKPGTMTNFSPSNVEVYFRSFSSVNTPGFAGLKKKALPENPFSATIRRTVPYVNINLKFGRPGTGWAGYRFHDFRHDPVTWAWPAVSISHDQGVRNKAIAKLADKAGVQLSANLAQDLAQFSQTQHLVFGTIKRITRAIVAVKKLRFGDAMTALRMDAKSISQAKRNLSVKKSVANNWLELQYGWKPLLQDVDESLRILAANVVDSPPQSTVESHAGVQSSRRDDIKYRFPVTQITIGSQEVIYRSITKIGVTYEIANQQLSYLAQTGFTNPINLAWEVLPFSFVVDWFLPIGPWLESLSSWDGLRFVRGYQTQFTRVNILGRVDGKLLGVAPTETDFDIYPRGARDAEWVKVDRTVLTAFPSMTLPTFKNPFSKRHNQNALALLVANFRR